MLTEAGSNLQPWALSDISLIVRANLQIAVCWFFPLSMLRFTVWRIGLF